VKRWYVVMYPVKELDEILDTIKREQFNIKVYCPMVKVSTSRNGIIKIVDKPLYFNYMFWRYDMEELPYQYLKEYIPFCLLRRKYAKDKNNNICYVKSNLLSRIKNDVKRLNNSFDRLRNNVYFLRGFIGKSVIIKDGVFTGLFGTVVDARKSGELVVEIFVFNRPINCEISVEYVDFV